MLGELKAGIKEENRQIGKQTDRHPDTNKQSWSRQKISETQTAPTFPIKPYALFPAWEMQ